MNKRRKVIVIIASALASTTVSYFGFGLILTSIIADNFINKRYSDISALETDPFYHIQKVRTDFPSLNEREEIIFKCNGENLVGYFYEAPNPKGVIVFAHGVNNLADGNHAQMHNYFLNQDYDVFAIDMTGCGRSGGKGMKTLQESRYCVRNAVKTVQNMEKTKDLPLFLIGHSWGGYGVVSATEDIQGVKAVVSMSGYNTPSEMLYGFAENNTSKAVIIAKPTINFSLATLYGDDSFFSAETAIKHNPDLPYVIIQGGKDTTVPLVKYSIYDHVVRDNYNNVTTIKLDDMFHGTPWKTMTAVNYMVQIESDLKDLKKQYKNNIPTDVYNEFIASIDKEKSSEVNTELLGQIDMMFTSYAN